jgi:Ran GTPase-activating protein (RanGAP) involved in mRNA processing and transport
MNSVNLKDQLEELFHFTCDPNTEGWMFEIAEQMLDEFTWKLDKDKTHSIYFPVNTWGLSSCNWLAENCIAKMKNLRYIYMNEKKGDDPRSDMPKSIASILRACTDNNLQIHTLDLSNNFLDDDGAVSINEYLATNSTLDTLKMNNCGLGVKSPALL